MHAQIIPADRAYLPAMAQDTVERFSPAQVLVRCLAAFREQSSAAFLFPEGNTDSFKKILMHGATIQNVPDES